MRGELLLLSDTNGEPAEIIGSWIDITERRDMEENLRKSRAHLHEAQHIAMIGSWEWDIASGDFHWSDEVFRIFGVKQEEFTPTYETVLSCVHPEDLSRVKMALHQALSERIPYAIEYRILHANGIKYVAGKGHVELSGVGKPIRMIGVVMDVTDRIITDLALQKREASLRHLAHFDALTDLPNRTLFQDRLNQSIKKAQRNSKRIAVLFLDIDNFKKFNDSAGHHIGDQLLKDVAERLNKNLRRSDTLARIAGDEFAIFIDDASTLRKIAHIAQHVLSQLELPFMVQDRQFFLTASIGISIYPIDAGDSESLQKSAEVAMHEGKKISRNSYQFFSSEMDVRANNLLQLENDLRVAIEENHLVLHYQPQVDLATGRLLSMEALVRWQHPQKGLIPPNDFIPMAENSGLILPIGAWVLQEACQQAKSLLLAGVQPFRMCVNISMPQFKAPGFLEHVTRTLKDAELAPQWLELEITESIAMENAEETISRLKILRELGIRVAIDDFGTGHSSLSYLKHLPITTLKIDKAFVDDILTDQYDVVIIEAILAMAKSLGLDVVAEGIETEEQKQILCKLGCAAGQGYLFSRPLPSNKLLKLFAVE